MPANVDFESLQHRIQSIDPIRYGKTRNFLEGAVTQLSPYISRGIISGRHVMESVLARGYNPRQIEKFLQELAWREYFQRVWQARGNDIFTDLKQAQPNVRHHQMVSAIERAETGIEIIDAQIRSLYDTGYLHNHVRMYLASICCNIAGAHWLTPAKWMYYHLLDGDLASNHLSWQWVAGAFSSKKYYCNQENINKYTGSTQRQTFLDKSYEEISSMEIPPALEEILPLTLSTPLPETAALSLDTRKPSLVYNSYNLDPNWRPDLDANRILLLEPSHFRNYPVSANVLQFIMDMSKNIVGIQIHVGEYADLAAHYQDHPERENMLIHKEHPAFRHYTGIRDERDWMFPTVTGYFPSFFAYWKKCERQLHR